MWGLREVCERKKCHVVHNLKAMLLTNVLSNDNLGPNYLNPIQNSG